HPGAAPSPYTALFRSAGLQLSAHRTHVRDLVGRRRLDVHGLAPVAVGHHHLGAVEAGHTGGLDEFVHVHLDAHRQVLTVEVQLERDHGALGDGRGDAGVTDHV